MLQTPLELMAKFLTIKTSFSCPTDHKNKKKEGESDSCTLPVPCLRLGDPSQGTSPQPREKHYLRAARRGRSLEHLVIPGGRHTGTTPACFSCLLVLLFSLFSWGVGGLIPLPLCSTIVFFKHRPSPRGFRRFSRKKDPWKEQGGQH